MSGEGGPSGAVFSVSEARELGVRLLDALKEVRFVV